MKHDKRLFQFGILIIVFAFLAVACDKDNELKNDEANLPKIELPVNSKKIDFVNSQHYAKLSGKINSINQKINTDRIQSREVTEDLTIVLEDVLYAEYDDTHTYTFKILRRQPLVYVENLVLHYNINTQDYDEYLVQYNITADQFVELSNNGQLQSSENVTITTLEHGFFDSNTAGRTCERVCETIFVTCEWGVHHEGNIGEWVNCTSYGTDGGPSAYQSCSSSCPIIDAGDSGSGGGSGSGSIGGGTTGSGAVITNPNANEPCENEQGTIGIVGNDGCNTTVEDIARNNLFDRLVNYMTSQLQADWIVLEADIEIVNELNNFLDQANFFNQDEYNNTAVVFIEIFLTIPNMTWTLIEDWFLNKVDFTEPDLGINPNNITYDVPLTQQNLPSFNDFVNNFPKNGTSGNYIQMPTSQVYQLVGGSLLTSHQNQPESYSNACSIRGSRGLLYSGINIPVLNYPGFGQRTQKGGDNNNYILDAVSFDKFMRDKFGTATYELTGSDANDPVQVANLLNGKNGIYVIINSSHTQAGYSGHVDAIINGVCISSAYATPTGGVQSIRIWELN